MNRNTLPYGLPAHSDNRRQGHMLSKSNNNTKWQRWILSLLAAYIERPVAQAGWCRAVFIT